MNARPRVLVIAGSDSSGGAGLLRDAHVLSELGVDVSCAVTAVTAQSNHRLASMCVMTAELIRQQVTCAFESGPVSAIKIGMLGGRAIVEAVVQALPQRDQVPIILDPVLASSSGTRLLDSEGVLALKQQLLPRCTLVTPNLMEAAALLEQGIVTTESDMLTQAERLLRMGPVAVLLKGGHAEGREALDILATSDAAPEFLRAERQNASLRGTGCALSSAIAVFLATGAPLASACRSAKEYVSGKLVAAVTAASPLQ